MFREEHESKEERYEESARFRDAKRQMTNEKSFGQIAFKMP